MNVNLKIISHNQDIFSGMTHGVYLPTPQGRIGILDSHENLISELGLGVVKIIMDDGDHEIFINGGVVEVKNNEIIILAAHASKPDNIIKAEIEEAIELAKKKLAEQTLAPDELAKLESQLKFDLFVKDRV